LLTSANKKDIERSVLDGIAKQLGLNIQQMVNAARHAATGSEEDISLLQGAKAVRYLERASERASERVSGLI
jgi:hypothetical protein